MAIARRVVSMPAHSAYMRRPRRSVPCSEGGALPIVNGNSASQRGSVLLVSVKRAAGT
jgi:hypothetical protein